MIQRKVLLTLSVFVWCALACETPPADDDDDSYTTCLGAFWFCGKEMVFDAEPDCAENLPPPSVPCLPPCGNELGVGQPCTKGGGECSDFLFSEAPLCTIDFDDTDMAFCTRACASDDQCGSGAYCAIDPDNPTSGAGCMPLSCKDDDGESILDGGSDG